MDLVSPYVYIAIRREWKNGADMALWRLTVVLFIIFFQTITASQIDSLLYFVSEERINFMRRNIALSDDQEERISRIFSTANQNIEQIRKSGASDKVVQMVVRAEIQEATDMAIEVLTPGQKSVLRQLNENMDGASADNSLQLQKNKQEGQKFRDRLNLSDEQYAEIMPIWVKAMLRIKAVRDNPNLRRFEKLARISRILNIADEKIEAQLDGDQLAEYRKYKEERFNRNQR
jgi:hypothetical protein